MEINQIAELSAQEKRALLAARLQQKARQSQSHHPLAYGQKALWFLQQQAPASAAYNIAFTLRILADVDGAALQQVLQTLSLRHPALRTRITLEAGEAVQTVDGIQPVAFHTVDASGWNEDELARQVAAAYQAPFDLAHGPLWRTHLFSRSAEEHILLLSFHHIICDAWSIWILVDELGQRYAAEVAATPAHLAPPVRYYSDYVQWQSQRLASAEGEVDWHYWRQQLAGTLPTLNLPCDHPRPLQPSTRGASYPFVLAPDLLHGLRQLSKEQGVTLFTTLLAAYQLLLHRYTGQDDLLVGSPTAGRSEQEFANVVGYFVNPIVLRANLSGNPSFQSFLQQVRATVIQGLAHQDYPFPLLVERLQPSRNPNQSPLFQAFFVLQKPQQGNGLQDRLWAAGTDHAATLGGLPVQPYALAQMEGQFELHLEITEGAHECSAVMKYNPDLFEPSTIGRMVTHLQTLLTAITADPTLPISRYPLLSPGERKQILVDWNATQRDYPRHLTLHQLFEAQVARTPHATAVIFADASSDASPTTHYALRTTHHAPRTTHHLTYHQLNQRANQLAHHLRTLGVGPDVLVGIAVERSLELVIGLYAILKAGGAYVPLDPSYPKERLQFMLADAQVPVLLTQSHLLASLPTTQAQVIALDTIWETLRHESVDNPPPNVSAENLAYMIYTSGSTGQPKGALNAHVGIVNRLLWMQEMYQLADTDRVLQKTPFSFDVSVWEFFWTLLNGATLVVAKPEGHKDSRYLVDLIASMGITTLHFVPSMLQLFLEESGVEGCRSLRQVFCSGEALPYELQERFFARLDARLHNLYGPTEAAVDVSYWKCQRNSSRKSVPIGRPVANTQLYILDAQMQPVPIGVAGELYIGGIQVGRGYHNRPELTQQRFLADPFAAHNLAENDSTERLYRTGDLAHFLPDGNIEYLGRIDSQIKLRGFRIELGEIETVLSQHPAVRECAVIVTGERADEKRLIAYVVSNQPTPDSDAFFQQLRIFLQSRLPEYMLPAHFVELEAMPLSPSGKLNRQALPKPTVHTAAARAIVLPQSETEVRIAEIWRTVLGIERVGVHDNFFELGGHSLLLGRVRSQLAESFQRQLSMVELFQYPTIHTLAAFLNPAIPPTPISQGRAEFRQTQQSAMQQRRLAREAHRAG